MVAIRVLPPDVVNRIAAGEVIERPASVVKELIENAIDAGASRIAVTIEEGGRKTIRVRDDGRGMAAEDLPLAFESHATSKLPFGSTGAARGADDDGAGIDLLDVSTLGFRGEALASIASVADVDVLSRCAAAEHGFRYRPRHGDVPRPAAAPPGTTIEVRNLFFNTPARRKFLKTVPTESSHVVELVLRAALGFPELAFRLEHGGKRVLDLAGGESVRDRIAAILGEEKARNLISVEAIGDVPGCPPDRPWLRGFVGSPRLYRSDARGQNLFVNGRWIRDRAVTHALREAFRGCLIPGRQPIAYLFVELPTSQVDINVHPQKTEVRFLDSQAVYRGVRRAVRRALEGAGVRPGGDAEGSFGGEAMASRSGAGGTRAGVHGAPIETSTDGSTESSNRIDDRTLDLFTAPERPAAQARAFRGPGARVANADAATSPPRSAGSASASSGSSGSTPEPVAGRHRAPAFQVLRSFIVTERDGALVFVDQHALHEKVLYERILRRLRTGSFSAQRLLMPEVVRLEPDLLSFVPQLVRLLGTFGFEVEPFGDSEVAVQAIPVILDRRPASEIVREVATWLRDHPGGEVEAAAGVVTDALRGIAALMACKQAVKAGARLDSGEIEALLEESARATDPGFCPHGRRTSVTVDRQQLERWFDRR